MIRRILDFAVPDTIDFYFHGTISFEILQLNKNYSVLDLTAVVAFLFLQNFGLFLDAVSNYLRNNTCALRIYSICVS